MCIDSHDNFTSDRIALGYAPSDGSGCVREMLSKNIIGAPIDVDHQILKKTSVERHGDRTILRFTVTQTPKRTFDGFRVMWAIGKVSGSNGNGCSADIGYHGVKRGVAPVTWLLGLNGLPCRYSSYEMGEMESTDIVIA